jgi:isopenicillin N synthase-like dioxygenase
MIVYTEPKVAKIPVIDLGLSFSPSLDDRRTVAREIHYACRSTGFFYVAHHGIPGSLVDDMFAGARRFFDRPMAEKEQVHISTSPARRGFEGPGLQALDPESPPDLKEGFLIGSDRGPDHPLVRAGTPRHGMNNWLADESDGLRHAGEAYFTAAMALGRHLMRLIALSLDLPETSFEGYFRDPDASLRMLHYPPHPPGARFNQLGCGAHTDWGAITILAQDDCGGLEVQAANGEWIMAMPIDGTFVVNIGDLLARWTNDLYRSTAHRVLNNRSGRDRYSAALFFDPDYFARIECLPSCQAADNPPRYPVCTAGDHKHELYCRTRGMAFTPAAAPEAAVA